MVLCAVSLTFGVATAQEECHRRDDWSLILQFVGSTRYLMFLPGTKTFWQFWGADILHVLKESPVLRFYVCDDRAHYCPAATITAF